MNPAHWWSLALPPFAREAFISETAVFFRVEAQTEHGPRRPNGEHPRRDRQAPKGARP